jgi:hypothetical protein
MQLAIYGSVTFSRFQKQEQVNAITLPRGLSELTKDMPWDRILLLPPLIIREDVPLWLDTIDHMTTHVYGGWDIVCYSLHTFLRPSHEHLDLIRACFERGLNPTTSPRSRTNPLGTAIYYASETKMNKLGQENADRFAEEMLSTDQSVAHSGPQPELWCIIALLIRHGADIYYMDLVELDPESKWSDLSTLWDLAIDWNMEAEWFNALEECGVGVDDYKTEITRRCKQAIRLHRATRSGIDEQVLELPSSSGLRCRKCRRRYCGKHGRDIFDPT